MKKILLLLALAVSLSNYSQAITVNTSTYTVPQLVNTVLINSPCVSATNITSKTGSNFGSVNGIGFFQNTNPNFPMQSGVILSTGNVTNAVGPNNTQLNDGSMSWPGDANLETTLAQSGIAMNSVNATILEFDFTPISPTFSFDFLFASEEYGNFQCQFSDAFAFLLTNMSTGVTTNLAVVPNTNLPISVVTIRDFLYNSSCASANAQYFGSYNGGSAAAGSAINFNGQTKLLNASATLVPNTNYHIKLVIADRSDESSDSAILISSDTFNIGQDVLGQDVTTTSSTSPCFGETYVLNSNLSASNYTFSWTKDSQPLTGETGSTLNITQSGSYAITYQNINNGCQPITDIVNVIYQAEIAAGTPNNLYKCDIGASTYNYDLSLNTSVVKAGLNPAPVITYHASLAEANLGTNAIPTIFSSAPGQTVYVRVKNSNNACYVVKSFQLLTSPAPIANQPPNLTKCATSTFGNSAFNLNDQNTAILSGQLPATYAVTYYSSLANANSGSNPLPPSAYYATNNTTVYARVENVYDNSCYSTTNFVLYISPLPLVDMMEAVVSCDPYTLPHVTNGNYFSGPNGTGTALFEGDVISVTKTIYIFNQPDGSSGCFAASSFLVTILDPLTIAPASGSHCGSFTLPTLPFGKYYTGDNGTGPQIPAGTIITTSQTIYVYFQAIIAPFCVISKGFDVIILPTITLASQNNVFDCTSYTLPSLSSGKYYTLPDGGGAELPTGTTITSSQIIYVYAISPNGCSVQTSFQVIIGIDTPADVAQCQPYTLPVLPIGNYYTGIQGSGNQIAAGTVINITQTIYVYVANTNCTDDIHFTVNIAQLLIDNFSDVVVCEGFTLPVLTNGNYYTAGNGTGTMLQAGDVISISQPVFIFKRSSSNCSNQSSFQVTISPKPPIDSRSDIDICNSYVLTELAVGNYFTGPNGTGTMLAGGTVITSTQLIYIYAVTPTAPFCTSENSFQITIFSIEADAPANVTACDSYTLPALNIGNYYNLPGGPLGGEGSLMHAGDVIRTTSTIYVYTESGERINCTDENSFTVTINITPVLVAISNINACNSYTLPQLTVGNYFTGPNGTGTPLFENDVISTSQTIYVYAQTATTPNCTDEKSFSVNLFKVDVLPNLTICENYTLPILTVGTYYTGSIGTGTQLNAGQVINTSQLIYVYGTSAFTPSCYDQSSFVVTIVVAPTANLVPLSLRTVCDEDGNNDGITNFDLTQLSSTVLGTQAGSEFTVSYYANLSDAQTAINPIINTNLSEVFVRVTNLLTSNCFDLKSILIKVNKLPEPKPIGGIICYESKTKTLLNPFTINSGLSAATHSFAWKNEDGAVVGTGSSYTAVVPGDYTVTATDIITGCNSLASLVTVSPSEPALVTYSITDDFSDYQIITVEAVGVGGDYEYQLDSGIFQDSPTFNDVSSGSHVITVRDKNGCGMSTSQALVINYPKFFTPNGDGFNDTWNIVDLKTKENAVIYIFDRYGKLLREIKPNGPGWDGVFSEKVMPSTDYWFTVTYQEDGNTKEFKSHFAVKR